VATVRKANPRTQMWSFAELVSTTPMPLVNQAEWKATASHNPGTAANGINGEGTTRWESGAPQAPGMWFQIELPQPAQVAEVLLDTHAGGRGNLGSGFGRGRGALPAGPLASYSVQVSMDGTTWSAPIAEGPGQNPTTSITFKPVQAKFVRITQTGTPQKASAWAIQRVRIFTIGTVSGAKP
ncbi:MAG: discoidin domain-containing protein, partial [Burkholderiales bacterium]